ncbi:MAG: putative secreted protein [Candidatus Phytoplasma pruni]|uniref:hypothetical protein n=1 Tax=Poinsettia branch-inducing phytoplasma TaxID=138647 RepID=UPI00037BC551|nr:hypothetical protein [Poinsettia branch-inducing phytoplasma]MDW3617778.1 hypothetical protein [Candidatus Phytoplasma pruni]WEK82409.1 MAG: putative secreted protein [Candidatus Phytoplasma pruni]
MLLIRIIVFAVIAVLIIGSIIAAQKGSDDKFFSFNIGPGNEESNKTTETSKNTQTVIVNVDLGALYNMPDSY